MPLAIFNTIFNTFVEALFPLHPIERWLSDTPREKIIAELPRSKRSSISDSFAVFSYKDERVQRLIWALKYKKSAASATIAGAAFERHLMRFARSESMPRIVVVPMPISKQRRRERGFNQCELIMGEIHGFPTEQNLLIRKRHTSRQTLKDKTEREEAHDLFAVDEKAANRIRADIGERTIVIVIDDVVTTGATMKTAVSCLRAAGFDAWGLSIAH